AGRRGRRPQVGRGGDRGTRARRAGHDPARRDLLPGGRARARRGTRRAGSGGWGRGHATMIWAVVPAAGRGARSGGAVPEQYLQVAGEPLIAHSRRALFAHPSVQGVVVALAEGDARWPGYDDGSGRQVITCVGGGSRAASVLAGLAA